MMECQPDENHCDVTVDGEENYIEIVIKEPKAPRKEIMQYITYSKVQLKLMSYPEIPILQI